MTREILFKAKRKDNGEWVEGGTGLYDADVFAGYCKWCGQRIKREE